MGKRLIIEPRYAKNLEVGDAVLLGVPERGAFGVVVSLSLEQALVQFQNGQVNWIPAHLATVGRNMLEDLRVELGN